MNNFKFCTVMCARFDIHLDNRGLRDEQYVSRSLFLFCPFKYLAETYGMHAGHNMVIRVVEFQRKGYKIRKVFGQKSIPSKETILFCELT